MQPYTRDHPERESSAVVRKQERQDAYNACRICGSLKDLTPLQFAHIYTHRCQNDTYVSSFDNCVLYSAIFRIT